MDTKKIIRVHFWNKLQHVSIAALEIHAKNGFFNPLGGFQHFLGFYRFFLFVQVPHLAPVIIVVAADCNEQIRMMDSRTNWDGSDLTVRSWNCKKRVKKREWSVG